MYCRYQPGVGGELVSILKGAKVSYSNQELLCPEDRAHTRQTSENPCLRADAKTLPKLLVNALNALL